MSKIQNTAPCKKVNILGRKRYSEKCNAKYVIEQSFDDCWRAITRLHILIIIEFLLLHQLKLTADKKKTTPDLIMVLQPENGAGK